MELEDLPIRKAPSQSKNRSRRLRKKLRIAEFQEFGFEFHARFAAPLKADQEEALLDAFIEVLEGWDLCMGGGITGAFVMRMPRGSVTTPDREQVLSWLRARPELKDVEGGELKDVWYE